MAGQRQPIALVQAKGKKHLTKAEIAEREQTEVKAPSDRVTPPSYLTATQKKAFRKTVKELRAIDLISNLDVEALAHSDRAGDIHLHCLRRDYDRNDRKAATDGNCGIRHRKKRCRRLSDHGRT